MSLEALLEGRLVLGRYLVDTVLFRGGMGVVYRASDTRLDRPVAVKVLTGTIQDPRSREQACARFKREAMLAARLHHPNVVRVYDYGTDEGLDLQVLVMELLEGQDLARRLKSAGPPPVPSALELLCQAAQGIAAGHRLGLVHRDVKPSNVFVSESNGQPCAHVLDFGIAGIVADQDAFTRLTFSDFTPHTIDYASPEQLQGGVPLSPASDVYSLGITAFEVLTGERAFGGAGLEEREGAAVRLSQRLTLRGISPAISGVIARAVAYTPENRFPDAEAVRSALELAAKAESTPGTVSDTERVRNATYTLPLASIDSAPHDHPQRSLKPLASRKGLPPALLAFAAAGGIVAVALLGPTQWYPKSDLPEASSTTDKSADVTKLAPTQHRILPSQAQITEIISRIRQDYQRIESSTARLKRLQVSLEGYSTEGGVADLYLDGSRLEKVTATHYAETRRVVEEFFFRGDSLFFTYRRTYLYDQPFGEVQRVVEDRFYFDRGELVRWRGNGQELLHASDPAYVGEERAILARAKKFLQTATSPTWSSRVGSNY